MPGILVGIDGSEHSHHALEWAAHEAALRHTPLTVITVHQAVANYWTGSPVAYPGDPDLAKKALQVAQDETDSVLQQADEASRPSSVTVKVSTGLPAEELLRAAEGTGTDMMVVGSRGAGGFKRLLLGSVSTYVTHHARCPVVVIPDDNA